MFTMAIMAHARNTLVENTPNNSGVPEVAVSRSTFRSSVRYSVYLRLVGCCKIYLLHTWSNVAGATAAKKATSALSAASTVRIIPWSPGQHEG